MPEDPNLFERAITAELIKIEKDLRKQNECLICIIVELIQSNKLAKKGLFLQFNVKDLTEAEVKDEYAKVAALIEVHSDATVDLAKKLMLGSP